MKVELAPWTVPNFVRAVMPARQKQDGFSEGIYWSLAEVDAETLSEQCDKFRAEIFRKAMKMDPKKANHRNHNMEKEWHDGLVVRDQPIPHIPQKEILAKMPKELHEGWARFIFGQTGLHCEDGDFGVYEWDFERFIGKLKRGEDLEDTVGEWD